MLSFHGGYNLRNHRKCGFDFSGLSSELHLSKLSQVTFTNFLDSKKAVSP